MSTVHRSVKVSHSTIYGRSVLVLIALLTCVDSASAQKQTFAPKDRRDVQTEVLAAVTKFGIEDEASLDRVTQLWATSRATQPRELLELTVQSFTAIHPETSRFVDQCRFDQPARLAPKMPKLAEAPKCYTANVGLFYGRYLTQRRLFDEGLEVLGSIEPKSVVDPASLIFFKAVCQQQLLRKKEGLESLDMLLKKTVGVPMSYRQVAELMEYELQNLEDKSLGEVSRMMGDVGRRLDLGRGGERVQRKEREIIARLDEMIEKLEQQQQNNGGGSSAQNQGGQQQTPSNGAQQSRVKGVAGKGEADEKRLAGKGGWGMLDAKAETKARASIKRKFPSHYSEAIKRYNIKLVK